MIEFISKFNPLRRSPSMRRIEEMEKKISEKEAEVSGLDRLIVEKAGRVRRAAIALEATAEEVLSGYDHFRGQPDV